MVGSSAARALSFLTDAIVTQHLSFHLGFAFSFSLATGVNLGIVRLIELRKFLRGLVTGGDAAVSSFNVPEIGQGKTSARPSSFFFLRDLRI